MKMENKKSKKCFVPKCNNTNVKNPNKIFVSVPKDVTQRRQWFEAVRRPFNGGKSMLHCCEDHFDIKVDMKNYYKYNMLLNENVRIQMQPGVIPHRFQQPQSSTSSIHPGNVEITNEEPKQSFVTKVHVQVQTEQVITRSTGIQTFLHRNSKHVQCNIGSSNSANKLTQTYNLLTKK